MLSQLKIITRSGFVAVMLLMSFAALAQKMDKPQIDKFTHDTAFFTTTEKIAGNKGSLSSSAENIEAYTSNKNGVINLHLKIELTTFDHNRFQVTSGNKVLIKLADNTLVTLTNIADVASMREGIGARVTGRECWTAVVALNTVKDDMARIWQSDITAIRIEADGQNFDFDIKTKDSKVIQKMFSLILAAN